MKLTSSNFSAAVGLNPYCSRQKLFRCLSGLETRPFVAAMQWGIDHECDAVAGVEMATGVLFQDTGERQKHYTLDCYGTTPDGRSGTLGLEVKCPQKAWDEPPDYYLPQIIGQAAIAGFDEVLFSCWTPQEQIIWRYTYDEAHWQWLRPLLDAFMDDYTEGREPKRQRKPALPDIELKVLND